MKGEGAAAYTGLFLDSVGISRFSTADSSSKLLVKATAIDMVKVSPSNSAVAIAYFDSLQNETSLYVYSFGTQELTRVKQNSGYFTVNLIWDNDSLLYANFCETKQSKTGKRKEMITGTTELINVVSNKVIQKSKPVKGAVLEAYIQGKYLVYSDYDGLYILDKNKNKLVKTLKGFSTLNMKSCSFSPDGKKLCYLEPKKVNDQYGEGHSRNELFLANFDGTKEKKIISFEYDPQNPVWSNANRVIACDVISLDWGNLRNIALYNVEVGKVSYDTEEENGFVPSLSDCHWSPSGSSFIVRKKIESQFFHKFSYIIKNVETGIGAELKNAKGEVVEAVQLGMPEQWPEDNVILFNHQNQSTIYTLSTNSYLMFPAGRKILCLKELQ